MTPRSEAADAAARDARDVPREFIPHQWWTRLATLLAALMVGSLLAGLHYTARLRLSGGHSILATTGLAVLAGAACGFASLGKSNESLGLAGLSMASVGASAFWLLLGPNKFAGPVIFTLGHERGVHLTDPLAAVPLALAAVLARCAWFARRQSPRRRTTDAGRGRRSR